jgi:hypothetical protein
VFSRQFDRDVGEVVSVVRDHRGLIGDKAPGVHFAYRSTISAANWRRSFTWCVAIASTTVRRHASLY